MTKTQLTELIATRVPHVPQRELEAMVNAVFELMSEALRKGERIEIRGFGCFAIRTRQGREARNPKTGVKVSVPPRKTLTFTVGKELRERIQAAGENLAPATAGLASLPFAGPATPEIAPVMTETPLLNPPGPEPEARLSGLR